MPGSRRLTVALAGGAGSGKSTVANALACRFGGSVSAFGDYVRHLAAAAGESVERANLQRIGQKLVETDPSGFVSSFLDWTSAPSDRPLIIDGVRHAVVDDALRAYAANLGSDYLLVLIDASVRERAKRRHAGEENVILDIDRHRVESEIWTALPQVADLTVDGSGSPEEVIARICEMVSPVLARRRS